MNETEKERLIKKDIESIENRVRHAFNQGYEMGMKESRSEIPNTCGDAISRQAALNAITMAEVRWQAIDNINKLPSVTPQQRAGRWIGEAVLDKIRAEIEQIKEAEYQIYGKGSWRFVDKCLDIIDKYKAESEDKK